MKILLGTLFFIFGYVCLIQSGKKAKKKQLWKTSGIILIATGVFIAAGVDIMMNQINGQ